MKKKNYSNPALRQMEMMTQPLLLVASVKDTKMDEFTEKVEIGEETDYADSRRHKPIWDDDDAEE